MYADSYVGALCKHSDQLAFQLELSDRGSEEEQGFKRAHDVAEHYIKVIVFGHDFWESELS